MQLARAAWRAAAAGALILGSATGALPEQVEIEFANFLANRSTEAPNIRAAIERFNEKHPDWTIDEQISGTDEYLTQFNVGAASGEVPDVFMMVGADVTGIVGAGLVNPITEDLEADPEWYEGIQPKMFDEFTRDGEIYSVPYGQIVTHIIFWNEDIFREAGIEEFPDTWEGFLEAVETLKEHGVTPIALGNKGRWVVVDPLFGTLAHRFHGEGFIEGLHEGTRKFTDPDFVAAIEAFQELNDMGAFNPDANSLDNQQQRDVYMRGDAAMFIEGSWAIPTLISDAPPEILEATRLAMWPAVPGGKGEPHQVTGGAGWSFAISPTLEGEEREAGIALLKELSNEAYGRSRLEVGLLPAQKLDASEGDVHRLLAEISGRLSDGTFEVVPIFNNAVPRSYLDLAGQELQELMVGNKTPEEVAESLQEDFERSM